MSSSTGAASGPAGGCAWAGDLFSAGATCRAARAEEALWAGLAKVHRGARARTALMHAAARGDAARAAWLLARGAPRDARDARGRTALLHALARDNAGAARVLLAAGAGVNAAAANGVTPLLAAVYCCGADVVEALLAAGADASAAVGVGVASETTGGYSRVWRVDGADAGLAAAAGVTPLIAAVDCARPDVVRALLAAGADARADGGGVSAVFCAMRPTCGGPRGGSRGSDPAALLAPLLAAGADADAGCYNGTPPLVVACMWRSVPGEFALALIAAGADVNVDSNEGGPLTLASFLARPEVVHALILVGARVRDRALSAACGHGDWPLDRADTVAALLVAGASVRAIDDFGRTPLIAASSNGLCGAVRALLAAGADRADRDLRGRSARDVARTDDVRALLDAA